MGRVRMVDVMEAANRSRMYGLGAANPNVQPATCPRCTTNPIWYIGTAIGGITILGLFIRAIAA